MRLSVLAFPNPTLQGASVALGTLGRTDCLSALLADRVANEDAFPGEFLVRLPKRLSRALRRRLDENAYIDVRRSIFVGDALAWGEGSLS